MLKIISFVCSCVILATSKCTLKIPQFASTLLSFIFSLALALQEEALSNYLMQPFGAHVPFILQFYIEHDIFGMGMVHFNADTIRFRRAPTKNRHIKVAP